MFIPPVIWAVAAKALLVDDRLGDYTTQYMNGIMIIQERGIPKKKPTSVSWFMIEGFWKLLIW
jgi:hypothetical protein